MRKFSTYDGFYTKRPVLHAQRPAEQPAGLQQTDAQNGDDEPIYQPNYTLSAKALKCYSAIKNHDELVKNILKKD